MAGLTTDDWWRLKDLEQQLVELGSAHYGDAEAQALVPLVDAGYASSPGPGAFILTAEGWRVTHALREFLAANRESMALTGVMPPFMPPAAPDATAKQNDRAFDIFARTVAAGAGDPNLAADNALAAAAAFEAKASAAVKVKP